MFNRVARFVFTAAICLLFAGAAAAQVLPTGTLTGSVLDPTPAAVIGAKIHVVDDATGNAYDTVSGDGGHFSLGQLAPGIYTVTITKDGFKKAVYKNVKIIVGQSYDLSVKLEVGAVTIQVIVEAGQEMLETVSASIGTSITGKAITSLPFTSRDATDLALLVPGAQTVGRPRATSFVGLPKGSINITIDGINAQDNVLKSNDGFFTIIRPRIDDVEEFSVTTAAAGVEQAAEGAVQIRTVSKRGGNTWHGGGWEYLRNDWFNANYFFNSAGFNNQPRQVQRLNEYGAKAGGPIFKDKLFIFADIDVYSNPQALTRSRIVPTVAATQGLFTYLINGAFPGANPNAWTTCDATANTCTANVLQLGATAGGPATIDTQIATILTAINAAATNTGTTIPVSVSTTAPSLYQRQLNFNNTTAQARKFPDLRLDWNITKAHSIEFDYHYSHFTSSPDFLNSADITYPVAPFNKQQGSQISNRNLFVGAWRWTIGNNKSNELRFGVQSAPVSFFPDEATSFYLPATTNLGPVQVRPSLPGSIFTGQPYLTFNQQGRNSALGQLIDTFTWTRGTHSMSFGMSWGESRGNDFFAGAKVGTVTFGLDSATDPVAGAFGAANLPGSATADQTTAGSLYAMLAGRINRYSGAVNFDPVSRAFKTGQNQLDKVSSREFGFYASDSWRYRPSLTISYGLRWEYQGIPHDDLNEYFTLQSGAYKGDFGRSGLLNFFQPGNQPGSIPTYVLDNGAPWYNKYYKSFAPSFGVAWQPGFQNDLLKKLFAGQGKTVLRAGYSISYTREGSNNFSSIAGANPGYTGAQTAGPVSSCTGTCANGTFVPGQYTLQSLNFPTNLQAPSSFVNSFQINPVAGQSTNAYDTHLRIPQVQSWSAGIQREISPSMVLEIRYVGNHGVGLLRQDNLNEVNIFENGFLREFGNALINLQICQAQATACKSAQGSAGVLASKQTASSFFNWGITDPVRGSQLPLSILPNAFTGSLTTYTLPPGGATNCALNSGATNVLQAEGCNVNWTSGTFISNLTNGLAGSFASSISGSLNFMCNLAGASVFLPNSPATCPAGAPAVGAYPANLFVANPDASTGGAGAFRMYNGAQSTYNALQVEFRRRPSKGLQFNGNYTFSRSLTNYYADSSVSFTSFDTIRNTGRNKGLAPFDIRHAFKMQLIYALPFGPGRKWSSSNWIASRLMGGWEINTITRWQSGRVTLLTGGLGGTVNQNDGGVQLIGLTQNQLDQMMALDKSVPGKIFWVPQTLLDSAKQKANTAFLKACATPGQFCGRDFIHGPQFIRADWSISKNTKITERISTEIRAEFLNAFNYPNFYFGVQGTTVGASAQATTQSLQSTQFGRITTAYQDTSTTDDFGGRIIQMVFRVTF
jgi:hypothetical protein